jgi:heat shock protein HslJ
MRSFPMMSLLIIVVAAAAAWATEPSWLDAATPAGWNVPGQRVPLAARAASPAPDRRCAAQYRVPSKSRADREVAKAGWDLVGPLQVFGATELVTAASGVDGMCRPLGYQAFVFIDGKFAGTLSPRPMDARTDGTASAIHLVASDRLIVEYARYTDQDPLCCPSAMSAVTFTVRRLRVGAVVEPVDVSTAQAEAAPPPVPAPKPDRAPVNTYWKLTRLGAEAAVTPDGRTEPHLVLRTDGHTVDGSGGCNRLGGTYRLEGAALSFGPLATTKMMCADAIEQERRFLAVLATVRGWRVAGDDLTLLDAVGAPVARFTAVDLQ